MSNNDYNLYNEQKAYIAKKYAANLASFYAYYGYDKGICLDFLLFNARCMIKGLKKAIIPGGGVVDSNELIADVKKLDLLVRK